MASVYARGKIRWVKFYPPGQSEPSRQSLGEVDPAMAELIRRKLELELKLRAPELRSVELPASVTGTFADPPPATLAPLPPPISAEAPPVAPPAEPVAPPSPPARKVLAEYLAHIDVENSEHHVKNKTGYLKKFFGSALMDAAIKDAALMKPKKGSGKDSKKRSRKSTKKTSTKRTSKVSKGVFKGATLADVQVGAVRGMIDGLPVGKKTKRHYRNAFHAFFEFAMKCGHYAPTNFRYLNPMSALPSYDEKTSRSSLSPRRKSTTCSKSSSPRRRCASPPPS